MSVMAIHPGEVLGEELKSRGISQKEFAQSVGMQATHLSALIHGMRNITPALAAKLETGLPGITAYVTRYVAQQSAFAVILPRGLGGGAIESL